MFTRQQLDQLVKNWSLHRDCLNCYAMARLYDPNGPWECYCYAIDPEQTIVKAIVNGATVEDADIDIDLLLQMFSSSGEGLINDPDFRPRSAAFLIKTLQNRSVYGAARN